MATLPMPITAAPGRSSSGWRSRKSGWPLYQPTNAADPTTPGRSAHSATGAASDRFWPLWIAGLHLTTLVGHALRLMSGDLVPLAYAVALRMWAYPELIILAVAVWRGEQRRRRAGSGWSPV